MQNSSNFWVKEETPTIVWSKLISSWLICRPSVSSLAGYRCQLLVVTTLLWDQKWVQLPFTTDFSAWLRLFQLLCFSLGFSQSWGGKVHDAQIFWKNTFDGWACAALCTQLVNRIFCCLFDDCGAERCRSWSFVPLMSLSTLNGKQGSIDTHGVKVMEFMKESVESVMDFVFTLEPSLIMNDLKTGRWEVKTLRNP